MERKYLWWQQMPANEIVRYAKEECDVAILPIGAIEQHGPHCPAGDDTYNAIGMAELVAKRTGAMLLPNPMYGSHPPHHWGMPGTIPLQNDTQKALLKDIIRGAAVAGYKKFIIFSCHGQEPTATSAVQELGIEGYFVATCHWYELVRDAHDEIFETPMWHAGECETSVALHLYPEYVDMSKADKEYTEPLIDGKFIGAPGGGKLGIGNFFYFEGTFSRPEYKELKKGIIGDATIATKEKGEKIVNVLVDRLSAIIDDIKTRWPVGEMPPVK